MILPPLPLVTERLALTCAERTCTEFRLRGNRATCTEWRRSESRFNYRKAEVAEVV
ncbi:hypothetical protein [Nostoc sp. C117]|uniref:hypothetical protein n=1 Tax=Nostoc sp. C117 TaxID=3349875 RepID=UPI00370DDD2D